MSTPPVSLNVADLLQSAGVAHARVRYKREEAIFTQGDRCDYVRFIEVGAVKLSAMSATGKEGVVAILGAGDFLGEGCLAGHRSYTRSATAIAPSTILAVGKHHMLGLLHQQHAMSDRFIAHMLVRNIRSEADLVDRLFNSSEKRLARTLLLLAGYGSSSAPDHVLLRISQETLAAMVGTTRSRINIFLQRFKKRGFVEYAKPGALTIHPSLLTMLLDE
jgi:CRP-like cAMP-binding protein